MICGSVAPPGSSPARCALPHDEDAVAHADQLRQLGRDQQDRDAVCRRARGSVRGCRPWRRRRCRGWARRRSGPSRWVASHLASTTFCWLPPREVAAPRRQPARRAAPVRRPARWRSRGGCPSPAGDARGRHAQREHGVVQDRSREHQPLALAVLGDEADAGMRSPAAACGSGPPGRRSRSTPRSNGSAPNSARASSVRPEPCEAGEADDLPGVHLEVDVRAGAPPLPPVTFSRTSPAGCWRPRGVVVGRARGRPSWPRAGQAGPRSRSTVSTTPAVLEHRDPVREREHLAQPVGDVEDPDADAPAAAGCASNSASTSPCGDSAAVGSSMTRMRASTRQRLGDLDHLLLSDRQVGDARPGRDDVGRPEHLEQRRVSASIAARGRSASRASGSRPRKTFSATVRSGRRLNSW